MDDNGYERFVSVEEVEEDDMDGNPDAGRIDFVYSDGSFVSEVSLSVDMFNRLLSPETMNSLLVEIRRTLESALEVSGQTEKGCIGN